MAIFTMGGEWVAQGYAPAVESNGSGCKITVQFKPNKLVKSQKIALIQVVTSNIKDAKNYDEINKRDAAKTGAGGAVKAKASRSDGKGHLDRVHTATNPIYGAPDVTGTIDKTPQAAAFNPPTVSFHLGDTKKKEAAQLHDMPVSTPIQDKDHMHFETAAFSIDGDQKFVWYGSVSWGYDIGGTTPKLRPFEVASMATPTNHFIELCKIWNTSKDSADRPSTVIPLGTINVCSGTDLVKHTDDQFVNNTKTALEIQLPKVKDIDKRQVEFCLSWLKEARNARLAGCMT